MQYDSYSSHLNYDNDGEIYIKDEKYDEKNVNWPEEYTHIPDYAFYDTKLEHITIPPTVVSIGRSAFKDCKYLNEISIPASVRKIGQEAFYNCHALKNVDIESLESWISIPFADGYANPIRYSRVFTLKGQPVETLYIDCKNYSLGQYAFFNARNIVNLRIRCNEIGEEAFAGCSGIKNLCLDVNSVGDWAFENCKAISTIYSTTDTPPLSPDNAFSNYSGVNLYVPYGSINNYENARNCWWRFLDVYESDFNNLDDLFGNDIINGINDIYSDSEPDTSYFDGEYELYNLNGLKISCSREDLSPGLYIVRQGGRAKKILVR
ncbi:MAG: leucine-rich repeat domain-containing protein [Muribaculaceae bacterium]|nr:leucine-rich repeat domain-containing protein [Muribaculaceae bacterium]